MNYHIGIVGGIGVGKTTLGNNLSKLAPDWKFFEEKPEKAAFIREFYTDKKKWAFHSRIGMLAMFTSRLKEISTDHCCFLFDRCIHELVVFARAQLVLETLSRQEFALYQEIFENICSLHQFPNVIIRCVCDRNVAISRIIERGRDFEKGVDVKYLDLIEQQYDLWVEEVSQKTRVLTLNCSKDINYKDVLREIAP